MVPPGLVEGAGTALGLSQIVTLWRPDYGGGGGEARGPKD